MSLESAQSWLANHDELIPSLDELHDQVIEMLTEGVASMSDIANIIMLDPGMSILMLENVNSRLIKSKRPGIDTVHIALGHLGKPAITTLITQYKKLSEVYPDANTIRQYKQLLSQGYHALVQLEEFTRLQGISTNDDLRVAMLLYNIGELQACLFDPKNYHKYRQQLLTKPDHNLPSEIFGFEFRQLGILLVRKWGLPELVGEAFETSKKTGRKPRLIQLAAEIANQAETGWYQPRMQAAQESCTDYLSLNPQETIRLIQNSAIQAAHSSPIQDVFSAAARLILLPDVEKPASTESVTRQIGGEEKAAAVALPDQIKASLQSPGISQRQVLNLLLSGLQKDLLYSRVVLLLLNGDKSKLATRTSKGLEADSAFMKLQLEVNQSGLISSLLQKPQALCISPDNYKKYEPMLPGNLKATCLCNNFAMMSIFIGNKPIGLIYCDRSSTDNPIDSVSYKTFKSSVMMTSKALTFLAKKNSRTTV